MNQPIAQHTEGPWIVVGFNIWGPVDPRSQHSNGRVLIGGVVDDVKDWRANPADSRDSKADFAAETSANAHIFAAGPDMLAKLREIACECGECRGRGVVAYPSRHLKVDDSCPQCADIRAVIAKAEGRQP